MDFRLERICPFVHPDTPQWQWCGRPCFCRPFIVEASARLFALTPGNSRAPNYDFDIMPGDRQPGFKPHPGYGDFRKKQDPAQRAKADAVAATLPHTGFGLLTHKPKPKPRPQDVEDAEVVSNSKSNTESNSPPVRQSKEVAVRPEPFDKKAYQRELMRKRREAKRRGNDGAQKG